MEKVVKAGKVISGIVFTSVGVSAVRCAIKASSVGNRVGFGILATMYLVSGIGLLSLSKTEK